MHRLSSATLPSQVTYDNCLISSCLKKLFTRNAKIKEAHSYTINNHVADVRKDLETVNRQCITEMKVEYLSSLEKSLPDAGFRYATVFKNGVPVLVGYFQLFTLTSQNFRMDKNTGFVKGILRFFLDLKKVRVLISGNALRTETCCFCYDSSVLGKDEASELAVSLGEKIADEECAVALILKDIPFSGKISKWMLDMNYQVPWSDKVMVMKVEVNWTGLPDYVNALSRKYKSRANKILASGEKLHKRVLNDQEINEYKADINILFQSVTENQSFALTQLEPDHFASLKKIYGENFEVLGLFNGQKLVAFYSAIITEDSYELYYAGFDYELNNEFQLYFNILFGGLERTILLKKQQLKLGRTAFDAKASLGAKPIDLPYFFKSSHLPSAAIKWFANYFSAMEDGKWKLRNPLKDIVPAAS